MDFFVSASTGLNPYITWAKRRMFATTPLPASGMLRVLVRCKSGTKLRDLTTARATPESSFLHRGKLSSRWVVISVSETDLLALIASGQVERHQLALPRADVELTLTGLFPQGPPKSPPILAIIDDGLPFAHEALRGAGGTRVHAFWPMGSATVSRTAINNQLTADRSDRAAYARFNYNRLSNGGIHGVGTTMLASEGHDSPLILVQLPANTASDPSGGALEADVLAALWSIGAQVPKNRDLIVLCGYGTTAGPHNGAGLFDDALSDWKTRRNHSNTETQVIFSAGNSRLEGLHGQASIARNASAKFGWQIQDNDATDNYVEIWPPHDPANTAGITVKITAPASMGGQSIVVSPGVEAFFPQLPNQVQWMCANNSNANGTGVLICIAATEGQATPLLAGMWTIELTNNGAKTIAVHAWIERDGKALGSNTTGRKSALVDLPGEPTFVNTATTLSRFGASAEATSVGAGHPAGASPASIQSSQGHAYSGVGPTLSTSSVAKPNVVVTVPDAKGQPGLRVRGPFNDSSAMPFGGSSAAAALWAGHRAKELYKSTLAKAKRAKKPAHSALQLLKPIAKPKKSSPKSPKNIAVVTPTAPSAPTRSPKPSVVRKS